MATEVDWTSVGPNEGKQGNGSSRQFVKFESGKPKTLRPVGKAVTFYKFFVRSKDGARSAVVDPELQQKASAAVSAHVGEETKPTLRYAINVIDRSDNQIKILEGGSTIFEQFANWSRGNNGAPPGGVQAMDWTIIANGEGLSRKYMATPIRTAPLSEEEITHVKAIKEEYSLAEVYKGCTIDELMDRLFDAGPAAPHGAKNAPAMAAGAAGGAGDPANW